MLRATMSVQTEDRPLLSSSAEVHEPHFGGVCSRQTCRVVFPLMLLVLAIGSGLALSFLLPKSSSHSSNNNHICEDKCVFTLIESIPENLTYPENETVHTSTFQALSNLVENAQDRIEIASFYWSLRFKDLPHPDKSAQEGQDLFDMLMNVGKKGKVTIKIVQNQPSEEFKDEDTIILAQDVGAQVRSINFTRVVGGGILHTKMWLIDRKHFYVGSANIDWRSLTQVKELGVLVQNCSCLAKDMYKIFEVYWYLGEKDAVIPKKWPASFSTTINKETPESVSFNGTQGSVYLASSPPEFCPDGRTTDIDAIVSVIRQAKQFVYIAVMDYFPTTIYTDPQIYWPIIDDELRRAAFDRGCDVRVLGSWWKHTIPDMLVFLKSLDDINKSKFPKVNLHVKLFEVPIYTPSQAKIPYGRVNHNKYMVTDRHTYIGTSNWSGDYFINTGGIGFVVEQPKNATHHKDAETFRQQLENVFLRDWNSEYSHPLSEFVNGSRVHQDEL